MILLHRLLARRLLVPRVLLRRVAAAGLLAAALLAGAAPALAAKIGAVLSITGPSEYLGVPEKAALEMDVAAVNAAGGVNGEKLELIVHDDGGDPNAAKVFARTLAEEGVIAIVGGTTTGTTLAMIPVAESTHTPLVSLAGGVEVIEPVRKWVFKTAHTDRMACERIFADLKRRGLARIAIVSGTDAFGRSMRTQCVKAAPAFGITVAHEERFGPADTDVTPQLRALAAVPDLQAVVVAGHGQGPAIVTRTYRHLDIRLPLYQSYGVASKTFVALAGGAADGVRLPASALLIADKLPDGDPQKPVVVRFAKTFSAATGLPVSTFAGHAHDALMLVVDAAKRAGGFDRTKLRDALEATKGFVGTGGVVTMSPTDHLGLDLGAFRMLEIDNGGWVLVSGQGS
ncbi:Branched-chain amino acid ABC transporter, amino acid-binding protein [Rhodovulum sp. PH10]|uniref:ABC transporter substrate-binding protein n=1 Tax=Rhodovulum sp. PH10 TaxID=1187851 RepID=UPI00027C27AE|nr:ABC transporter substrate-binding protein [Rhodovulum sp. PH10]EJW11788.1 Branched-chain amino acid ABC transporter, amino acid-binding protein [Rhodovulum sp. PH10]